MMKCATRILRQRVEPISGRVPRDEATLVVLRLEYALGALPLHVGHVQVKVLQADCVLLLHVVGCYEADARKMIA